MTTSRMMSREFRGRWLFCMLFAVFAMITPAASAHDARPVAVTLTETVPGVFLVAIRVPPSVEADNIPHLVWPAACEPTSGDASGRPLLRCEGGLQGQELSLEFPLFNPSLATFYRVNPLQGAPMMAMLPPTKLEWQVPEVMTPVKVAVDYTYLGVEHIISGYDHLLFVFGLLVIARTWRRVLLTVTGFTVAHSITLTLSSLGVLRVPIPPVEATIALSIVFLAHEISRQRQDGLTYRYPMLVSFSFGLLHGFGFASALGEIGLADNDMLLSLLFFNVGVEIGQLSFIACVAVLAWLLGNRLSGKAAAGNIIAWQRRGDLLASYVIGIPAAYWLVERLASQWV